MKTCNPTRLTALSLLACLGFVPIAQAATTSTTFQVTATVTATCSVSAGVLAFGAYTGGALNGVNVMTVTCTTGTSYGITLDDGLYVSGSQRRMKNAGTDYLNYDLYTDITRTVPWQGVTTVADTGDGTAQSHPVYGRIPGNQYAPSDSYADTISVTVTY